MNAGELNAQRAPAKINLGLHVLRRRADGYHDLQTVFLRIPWADRLTARPAEALAFTCSDSALPTDGRNLCVRAAWALIEAYGVEEGAELHLEKTLPYGAGLGGGSSDAAATLRLLAEGWGIDASEEELHKIAAALGSDVPFFLSRSPAAYATGRGEKLEPLTGAGGEPYALPFALVVVVPEDAVATAEAYGWVTPAEADRPDLRAIVRSNSLARWRAELVNDFEAPVLERHPAIRAAKGLLAEAGAGYAALSGSGSAVFGVFEDDASAEAAAEAARQSGHRVWHGALPAGGPAQPQ